ncbi:Crp/Fnr family transcriptional regulator [Mesorhizobium sp. ANAO-SY3R2]|uniref:Crp/Fnr family transcriptional regulator n=1 Tax=Mesorhizobium sp. ANAO-SY3R2 TaxID=3166644 RepID=UPI00366EAEDB
MATQNTFDTAAGNRVQSAPHAGFSGETRNKVLLSLRPEAQVFLQERLVRKPIAVGDVIFADGAPVTHAVFPNDGVISYMAEMEDGRSVEKASIGFEGFVGVPLVMGGGNAVGRTVVQVAGDASWLSIDDLNAAHERFVCVREAMLRYSKSLIVQLMESVACNSLHTAEQRVTRWLLQTHDRVRGDTFILTQETVSQVLGLRRATVSGICSELFMDGIVNYHRGHIAIRDRSALQGRTCECYRRVLDASLLG